MAKKPTSGSAGSGRKVSGNAGRRRGAEADDQRDPTEERYTPQIVPSLDRTRIAIPLLDEMRGLNKSAILGVIIDANLAFPKGARRAREVLWETFESLRGVKKTHKERRDADLEKVDASKAQYIDPHKSEFSDQYLFGRLSVGNIREYVRRTEERAEDGISPLYRVWLDHEVNRFTNFSVSTVKADAARNAFNALGRDIVWAVLDTGVDRGHPHFARFRNLEVKAPIRHRDFTGSGLAADDQTEVNACVDVAGHGTHVAGIVAGYCAQADGQMIRAEVRRRDEKGDIATDTIDDITVITGMAPECRILSLKVLDDKGQGSASNIIAALEYIQELNGHGRRIVVHGVNLSVGYDFEPKWFACGQSPLCVEVNRLVRSGVVAVVAAGNTGYGFNQSAAKGTVAAGQGLTINDPGNAELAITVGSTHREMPHMYGVSYFSSKGPTGDGRMKPDLVAPGEKIISCRSSFASPQGKVPSTAASGAAVLAVAPAALYKEDSGTSMAAPHVSGVIAAFLSARREFIGRPEAVKEIFMRTATDLGRDAYFQGKGLIDLMRAIQSV